MRTVTVTRDSPGADAERVGMCVCSGNVSSTLRVMPVVGRPFPGGGSQRRGSRSRHRVRPVASQFGGSGGCHGKSVKLDNETYEVIGVAREVHVSDPDGGAVASAAHDHLPQQQIRHDLHYLRVIGRLRSGVSIEQGRAGVDGISARYKAAHPQEATGQGVTIIPLHKDLVGDVRRPLFVLFGAVLCVLLIACLNIANLILTRAMARRGRLAFARARRQPRPHRPAAGHRERVLGLTGGAVGALLALWLANVFVARAPGAEQILPSGRVPLDPKLPVCFCDRTHYWGCRRPRPGAARLAR